MRLLERINRRWPPKPEHPPLDLVKHMGLSGWAEELERLAPGNVRRDVSLAKCSSYRIGGGARVVVSPETSQEVGRVLQIAAAFEVPWMAIGLGSNLLFDDAGIDGVVIRIAKNLSRLSVSGNRWTVGAGTPTPTLARKTAAAGATGVHRLIGIPGAVGGGVFMNAGAHGQEFKDVVDHVDLVEKNGELVRIKSNDIQWTYRSSGLSGVIVSVALDLAEGDPKTISQDLRRYLTHRREGTPFDQPCCGSVFRNPSAEVPVTAPFDGVVTAGRLIEAAGLKGYKVGGAEVSHMHANYVVNKGGASAVDVRTIIADVTDKVDERFGVRLQREVKYVTPKGEIQ